MRTPAVLAVVTAVLACGGNSDRSVAVLGVTERDSAGVRIVDVDSTAVNNASLWTAVEEPLSIGMETGPEEYLFADAASPRQLSNGSIAVANNSFEVRFYDARGKYIRSLGRRGNGPGEFREISNIFVGNGDSLIVLDASRSIISVFDSRDSLRRTFPLSAEARDGSSHGLQHNGALGFLRNYGALKRRETREVGVFNDSVFLISQESGEEKTDTLARMGGYYTIVTANTRAQRGGLGEPLLSVGDSSIVGAFSGEFVLRAFHGVQQRPLLVRVNWPREPITEAAINSFKSLTLMRNGERVELPFDSPASEPLPLHLPPLGGLIIDRSGRIWVKLRNYTPTLDAHYIIFSYGGRPVGRIMLPGALSLSDVGADYVLGIFTNHEGVETVRRYRYRS